MSRSKKRRQSERDRSPKGDARRARRRGRLRRATAILAALTLACGVAAGGVLARDAFWGTSSASPKTAAIVDQLSLSQPSPTFVDSATRLLEQAGYAVDYYPSDRVTVDFYRNLPTFDYDLIVARVHSGITNEVDAATGEKTKSEYVSLFTGEPYSATKYPEEQINRLGRAEYYQGAPPLFGIGPDFVRHSMRGKFDSTLIVMMGCDGLRSERTAQAFIEKGAGAFVSWSRSVSAEHSDAATQRLLEKLLIEGLPLEEAVAQTMVELGPDPEYDSTLLVYPPEG